ncbi:MAG: DUF167 domain-containing protein [Elusimicrobia bacterium]|nr:DUF167 domain-containing protein [Elusimicrobiota bacterium]
MAALFKVKAHPASREDRIDRRGPDSYEVWVRAKAENGKANSAVLLLLARELCVEAKRLRIVKGASSPSKIVTVLGGS